MTTSIKNLFPVPALIAGLGLMLAGQATAQTFTTLYSFTDGSDGSDPWAGLVLSGNTLYGTAAGGGSGHGTVYAVNTDGTGFTTLHSFGGSDGAGPVGPLVLSANILYGTAEGGGSAGYGTVFAINTDGTDFTTLYSFTNGSDGAVPLIGLILSGSTLYGTTGGIEGSHGTVFAINTNGTGFTTLYSFNDGSDGGNPRAGLVLSGNTLYGTTFGTVFAVNTDGTGFTTLDSGNNISDAHAGLVLSDNTLYGTTSEGGASDNGTVFALTTDGTGFTILYSFTADTSGTYGTNSDGRAPSFGRLVLSGNTLYGTAEWAGSSGVGTVFAVNTDGTDFTTLYTFTNGIDGANPQESLILSGNTLYGTTGVGGISGNGVVFSLTLPAPPQLTITLSGTNVILTWTNTASAYILQSTASLGSPTVWTAVSPAPVVIGGQNTVTNPISGTQQFYRLSQ